MSEPAMILRRLASLKLTVPLMMVLTIAALVSYRSAGASVWWLAAPLLALSVNLFSAIAIDQRFRRRAPLLAFHVCLLVLLCLMIVSQLTSLRGRMEIVVGQSFDPGSVEIIKKGPFHADTPFRSVAFEQGPITVEYEPRLVRGRTRSTIKLNGMDAAGSSVVIGDNIPFNSAGYRFYTTSNKGYAVVVTWHGSVGPAVTGAVHMPSYPRFDWKQVRDWTTPGGTRLELELELPGATPAEKSWVLDSRQADGSLHVKSGDGSVARLAPGDSLVARGGTLRFDGVRMWMGYEVQNVPLLPWMFATAFIGVLALGWHFYLGFGLRAACLKGSSPSGYPVEPAHV